MFPSSQCVCRRCRNGNSVLLRARAHKSLCGEKPWLELRAVVVAVVNTDVLPTP
ncbi:hypothetical protein FHX48_000335 [Microbacterium halimionae]|uniref:Uncharacterized protein n=1 Tax=Microbacterium halimionae TaxID=1526413 RepID=A0A7W3JM03_9MICO|nr:hypothetical protein [Microbacterium halimionae]NII93926.1 hypothetical protein [Microbacterium halimionae]